MNTVQLECFLAVAEYMNFSRAAEALKITQPAVSHQISSLEDELGAKLFRRTSKSVSLTQTGILFMEDASAIVRIASGAKRRLGTGMEDFSRFQIGCHNQSELDLLPQVIRRLIKRFPSLHPTIKQIPFKAMANLLSEGRLHVMFGFGEEEQMKQIGTYHELDNSPLVCVCHESHPFAEKKSLTAEELRGPMVVCEPKRMPQTVFQAQIRISSALNPADLYFAEGYESALTLVSAGLGFSLFPAYVAFGPAGGAATHGSGLCCIPVEGLEPVSFGVYYKGLAGNPVLKEFIRLLDQEVSDALSGTWRASCGTAR